MTITIFTKQGAIRDDFTEAELSEIASLSEAERTALDKLIAASKAATAAEAALKNEDNAVKTAMATQAQAAREVERVTPKLTHHSLYSAPSQENRTSCADSRTGRG